MAPSGEVQTGAVTRTPAAAPRLTRHPDFLKLWTAETISVFGTQVTNLALPLVAAQILAVSSFEFGLLGTIEFLPFVLLSLPAGVWVDRLRRRPILVAADIGRAVLLATIPIAHALGTLSLLQLYLVGFLVGALTVFFDVAYQSYLPSVVERDQLVEGNSKLEISRSSAQVAGPGLAGILIGAVAAPVAILVDAVSFLVSGALLAWIRRPEARPEPPPAPDGGPAPHEPLLVSVRGGLVHVGRHPWLRAIAATTGISNLFGSLVGGVLVLYLVRDRGLGAAELGVAFSLGSTGVLVAAISAGWISRRLGLGRTLVAMALMFSAAGLPLVVAPPELSIQAAVAMVWLGGFAGVVWNVNQVSLRQAITPPELLGRMNATMRFIVWGTIPVGTLLGGALGDLIGLRETIVLGAVAGTVAFVPVALSSVRRLERIPEPEPDPA